MLVMLPGIVMLVRLLQPLKAPSPKLVTLSGMAMLVRPVQLQKADVPILVTQPIPVQRIHLNFDLEKIIQRKQSIGRIRLRHLGLSAWPSGQKHSQQAGKANSH